MDSDDHALSPLRSETTTSKHPVQDPDIMHLSPTPAECPVASEEIAFTNPTEVRADTKVFKIQELVDIIVAHISLSDDDDTDHGRLELLGLAQIAPPWRDPVMARLWRTMPSLRPLHDLVRAEQAKYTTKIHHVAFQDSNDLNYMNSARVPALPFLKTVVLGQADTNGRPAQRIISEWACVLLGPELRELTILTPWTVGPRFAAAIIARCPLLERMVVCLHDNSKPAGLLLARLVNNLPRLRHLTVEWPLGDISPQDMACLVKALGDHPSLTELSFLMETPRLNLVNPRDPDMRLPNLLALQSSGIGGMTVRSLAVLAPSLQILDIYVVGGWIPGNDIILDCNFAGFPNLKVLGLEFLDYSPLTGTDLANIGFIRTLRELTLTVKTSSSQTATQRPAFHDGVLALMSLRMPKLTALRLRIESSITGMGLLCLGENCRSLMHLEIPKSFNLLDMTAHVPSVFPIFPSLLSFKVEKLYMGFNTPEMMELQGDEIVELVKLQMPKLRAAFLRCDGALTDRLNGLGGEGQVDEEETGAGEA